MKISTEEDEGRRAKAINKRYQLTEESTLNLKSRDASEGEVLRNLASGRHCGRGEEQEIWKWRERPVQVCHHGATAEADGWRYGGASYFVLTITPRVQRNRR